MDNNKIIIVDKLVKDYSMGSSFFRALNDISFETKKGEFTGLIGPSGSGKTTLLNILGALDNPTQGDAIVLGKSVKSLSHKDSARLRNNSIGFIFQTYNMLPVKTVFQRFPRLVRDLARSQGKEVRLVIEGEGIELDKTILEQIGDPLVHRIRNAVDHGLEPPELR